MINIWRVLWTGVVFMIPIFVAFFAGYEFGKQRTKRLYDRDKGDNT